MSRCAVLVRRVQLSCWCRGLFKSNVRESKYARDYLCAGLKIYIYYVICVEREITEARVNCINSRSCMSRVGEELYIELSEDVSSIPYSVTYADIQ